jgi:exosome complex component RRP42
MMSKTIVSRLKRKKIQEIIATGKRMDGRGLFDYRELVIKKNPLEKSEGSAEVWLGKTHVLVGIKANKGRPFEDTPEEGVMMVNAEFTPIAHSTWEPGPPNEASVELARIVDRGIRSAEVLDMKKLNILSSDQVYIIFVDLYILNYDGNLIDACAAGAIAALETAELPVFKEVNGVLTRTDKKEKLQLKCKPIAVTFVKIGDDFLLDPSADEEEVKDVRFTVTVDENGNITTLQKSGTSGLTQEEIKKSINIALENAPKIRVIATAN